MRHLILGSALAVLLLPSIAIANPSTSEIRSDLDSAMVDPHPDRFDFTCASGGPTSLGVGVAMLGLLLRRRR